MWHISSLLWGTLSHYCGAHYHLESTQLWGYTIVSCGTFPHFCGAHFHSAAHLHTIVAHINLRAGHQPSGQGGAPRPVLEIHTLLIVSHHLRPLKFLSRTQWKFVKSFIALLKALARTLLSICLRTNSNRRNISIRPITKRITCVLIR